MGKDMDSIFLVHVHWLWEHSTFPSPQVHAQTLSTHGLRGVPQADVASLEAALMAARAEYEKVTERNLQVYISTSWGSECELCTHI